MSYKLEVKTMGDTNFASNGLRFATEEEGKAYERDLTGRWFAITESRVVESNDPVTHVIKDGIMSEYVPETRTLGMIANEIRKDWNPVWFGAKPYLNAMATLESINDNYGMDSGKSIVLYFLSNATTWKGETARRIKKELKALAKIK